MQRLSAGSRKADKETQFNIGRFLIVLLAGIFVVSLGVSLWILRPSDRTCVEIVSDGEVLYTFELASAENQVLTIDYHGSSNTIEIKDGEIWVEQAQCPDKTCVEMGRLRPEGLPIVCLPNRLIIRFAE